jgi:hypothetical protein
MPARVRFNRAQAEFKPVMGITRQNNFLPQLMAKLGKDSFISPINLQFSSAELIMTSTRTYGYTDGKFIARSFLRAGIAEITTRDFLQPKELAQLQELLNAAQEGRILPLLPDKLRQLDFIQEVKEVSADEVAVAGIPGQYKHYTDKHGYYQIVASENIAVQPDKKNGEYRTGLYLTSLSLSPTEAHEVLFMRMPEYRDRGSFVISFDIVDQALQREVETKGIESFIRDNLRLNDPRIKVRYLGPNYLEQEEVTAAA